MSISIHCMAAPSASWRGDKLYNTTLVFSPEGRELARYRKIHLFDITTPDGQGYKESSTYGAGDAVVSFDAGGLQIGLAICYDLRFPELFLALRRQGVDLIVLPAAFTLQTGKDHWEVLLRARAIETQCYIAAPACTGSYTEGNGETAVYLWACADRRSLGPCRGQGLGRAGLGECGDRPGIPAPGARQYAGARASETRLSRIAFVAAQTEIAIAARSRLTALYGDTDAG